MHAVIISIGDELALGQTIDTNAGWLSARLIERGVPTRYHKTVPDDMAAIVQSVCQAAEEAEWVILTGGMGPTRDDLTRQALSEVMKAPLVLHTPSLKRIERFFQDRGRKMSENVRVQAMYPKGSEILENPCGTAPGLKVCSGKATIFVFPGVPEEMKAMFEKHIIPAIAEKAALIAHTGRSIVTKTINTFGFGESTIGEQLGELMARGRNPTVGTTVSCGIVSVRIRSDFNTLEKAQAELVRTAVEVTQRLADAIFSEDDETLQYVVGRLLMEQHKTVATAESCTAGLVGEMLTEKAGASGWYLGGWIVYDNQLKTDQLGVPAGLLSHEGAVSEPVAKCMAEQAVKRSGADYALALTGIAGPDGGTPDKPIGTIWIALGKRQTDGIVVNAERFVLPGDRTRIRDRAAKTALNLLRLDLMSEMKL